MKPWYTFFLAVALISPCQGQSTEQSFFATVVGITERNSVLISTDASLPPRQLVLAYISLPIEGQPYNERANSILKAQLLNQKVRIQPKPNTSGEHFISGIIYIGKENFNLDMVSRGHAWVNDLQYPTRGWINAQVIAKREQKGLWENPEAVHPREWARMREQNNLLKTKIIEIKSNDVVFERMKEFVIGNIFTKTYFSFDCAKAWSKIPNHKVRLFTSEQRAITEGYEMGSCD